MTKAQVRKKTRELIGRTKQDMQVKLDTLLSAGCLNLDGHGNDYLLPKAIMVVLCENAAEQWLPPQGSKMNGEINQMGHFI